MRLYSGSQNVHSCLKLHYHRGGRGFGLLFSVTFVDILTFIWMNLPSRVGVLVMFSMIGFMLDLTRYDTGCYIKPNPKILEKKEFKVPLTIWLQFFET